MLKLLLKTAGSILGPLLWKIVGCHLQTELRRQSECEALRRQLAVATAVFVSAARDLLDAIVDDGSFQDSQALRQARFGVRGVALALAGVEQANVAPLARTLAGSLDKLHGRLKGVDDVFARAGAPFAPTGAYLEVESIRGGLAEAELAAARIGRLLTSA